MFNLTVSLDPGSETPMYEQLYAYFTGEIRSGRLKRGEKLPSKRALSEHLGVSLSTVEAAYGLLTGEGYVESRPRSGLYVSDYAALEVKERAALPAVGGERSRPSPPEFDFSTASVDVSLFPYSSWARLNREVVYSSPELLQRGDRQGDPELRAALAEFLGQYRGVVCSPEDIVVGAGMEYLTGLIVQLMPGDAVFGVEDPGYDAMYDTVRSFGRRARLIPVDGHGMSVSALRESGVTVAYLTPSHQFPMGVTMPASRRSHILKWAAEREDRYVIEDDYDSEFRHLSRPVPSLQGMDRQGRVIYVGTFSRSIAPGIRVAYMVLPHRLMERYRALFGHRLSTVSRFEQQVLARFLTSGLYARYLRRVSRLYARRRASLVEALSKAEGVEISGDEGGIHFLLKNERFSEPELISRALEAGITLQGVSRYCRETTPPPSTLVVGYGGLEDGKIAGAARRLREAWS